MRSIPRAEKFGDLITADHKVFNEGSESRNNHRYAVMVQDLATQWIQSYPCKDKNSQETEKSLRKFLEPLQSQKLLIRTFHWNLAGVVKNYHGIIERLHFIEQRQAKLQNELSSASKRRDISRIIAIWIRFWIL